VSNVILSPHAAFGFEKAPTGMIRRINDASARLERWPKVIGAKPLRGNLKGCSRLRCCDWRIVFRPVGGDLVVITIDNRRDVSD